MIPLEVSDHNPCLAGNGSAHISAWAISTNSVRDEVRFTSTAASQIFSRRHDEKFYAQNQKATKHL